MHSKRLSRRLLLRVFASGSASLLVSSLIASCGPTPAPAATEVPAEQTAVAAGPTVPAKSEEKFTLRLMINFIPEYLDWAQKTLVPKWQETYPGGSIEVVPLDWSRLEEQLLTSKAAGSMPDLYRMGASFVPIAALNNLSITLDERLKEWPDTSDFYEASMQGVTWDGKVWGLPDITAPRDYSYRKDLSDEAGVTIPDDWTWDDYLDAAVKLTIREDSKLVRMGSSCYMDFIEWMGILWSANGRFLRQAKAAFNSEEGLWALSWIKQRNNSIAPEGTAPLAESPIPYIATGQWVIGYYQAIAFAVQLRQHAPDKLQYLTLPQPALKARRVAPALTDWIAIAVTTKYPDAAWDYLKLHGSVESVLKYNENSGDLPPRKSAVGQSEYMRLPIVEKVMKEMDTFGQPYIKLPSYQRFDLIIKPMIEATVLGQKTAEEALAEGEKAVNEIMADYPEWPDTEV